MASDPCDRHGIAVRGRLCHTYPALIKDGVRMTAKQRLCVDCLRELLVAHASDWLDYVLKADGDVVQSCTRCGLVVDGNGGLSRFFCTAYLDGRNRRDYYALYCPACTAETVQEFSLHAA